MGLGAITKNPPAKAAPNHASKEVGPLNAGGARMPSPSRMPALPWKSGTLAPRAASRIKADFSPGGRRSRLSKFSAPPLIVLRGELHQALVHIGQARIETPNTAAVNEQGGRATDFNFLTQLN